MLIRLGIFSNIYDRTRIVDGLIKGTSYAKDGNELIISSRNIDQFAEQIGFADLEKQTKLLTDMNVHNRYNKPFTTNIDSLTYVGKKRVYDCTIPNIGKFDGNGIVLSNCGEQFLHPGDNCNLGSVNLDVMWDEENNDIDYDKLYNTIIYSVRMLDNVIELFGHNVSQINDIAKRNRRIGLGVMGLADLLFRAKLRYGTRESIDFCK